MTTSRRRAGAGQETLAEQVARQVRTDIEAGVLRDGEALPSTRALAKLWDVSVYTANEALAQLTREGLIDTRDRSGRVVVAPDREPRMPRPQHPRVVFVGGYAGSGKTELGRILARLTGWPIIDKDTMTRPLVELTLETLGSSPHDRESLTYLERVRDPEYEALLAVVDENLACGASVVATAPFIREFGSSAWLERVTASAESVGATPAFVWVYCDADSMRTYIRRRGAARDSAKVADWDAYLRTINLDLRPTVSHTVIDNSLGAPPLQEQAAKLVTALGHAT